MVCQDCALTILQAVAGILCFTLPGTMILSLVGGREVARWPLALLLSASFLISSLALAGIQAISTTLLPPVAVSTIAFVIAGGCLAYLVLRGRSSLLWAAWRKSNRWERLTLGTVALVGLAWLLVLQMSPYPSQLSVDMGDPPVYFHAAARLVQGQGWKADYFVGDYPGGQITYLGLNPLPVLVTSFFFGLFGINWHSLYVYDMLAAGLLAHLLGRFITSTGRFDGRPGPALWAVVAAILLMPAPSLMFGLGTHTIPGMLGFATVAAFWGRAPRLSRPALLVLVAAIVYLLGMRPESAVLGAILATVLAVWWLFARMKGKTARAAALVGIGATLLCVWWQLPAIWRVQPAALRGLAVRYVRFDRNTRSFTSLYGAEVCGEINQLLCQVNFGGADKRAVGGNPRAMEDIQAHPLAFADYLVDVLTNWTSVDFLASITVPERGTIAPEGQSAAAQGETSDAEGGTTGLEGETTISQAVATVPHGGTTVPRGRVHDWPGGPPYLAFRIIVVLLLICCMTPRYRPVVVAAALYLLALPLLNLATSVRHVAVVSLVVAACAAREVTAAIPESLAVVLSKGKVIVAPLIVAALVLLAASDLRALMKVRSNPFNCSYVNILQDTKRLTARNSLIASSYPQLITCMTGRPGVGGTWLMENLEGIIEKFAPDVILVDNARGDPKNYTLLKRRGGQIPGYTVLADNSAQHYAIFRRDTQPSPEKTEARPARAPGG